MQQRSRYHPQTHEMEVPVYRFARNEKIIKPIKTVNQPINQREPSAWVRFLKILDEYCFTSTLHGLKYIGNTRLPKYERWFWLTAFLLGVAFSCYFICVVFIQYFTSPIIVSFNPVLAKTGDVPFPAITICNFNVALKRRAEKLNKDGSDAEKVVLEKLCAFNKTNFEGNIEWDTFKFVMVNTTQKCHEMIVYCEWQGQERNCSEIINPALTDDGYCCSFNKLPLNYSMKHSENDFNATFPPNMVEWNVETGYPANAKNNSFPYRSFGRGEDAGLTLALDADLDEYYCSTTSSIGFKAVMATPTESPKISDVGFFISPGTESRFMINVDIRDANDDIKPLNWNSRQCFFASERKLFYYKFYTHANCVSECQSNLTLERCGCIPFYLPKMEENKICDKAEEECADEISDHIDELVSKSSDCNCLAGCNELFYSVVESTALLSANHEVIRPDIQGRYTTQYFAKNVAIVNFFYSSDTFQKTTKSVLYEFSEFLSNTGGLLGLFLGFSFLSVVEIFYFLTFRGLCKFRQNQRPIQVQSRY